MATKYRASKYAVATIDNHAVAKLSAEETAHKIELWIDRLVEQTKTRITKDMTADERTRALALRDKAQKAFDDYIETQRAMFQMRGLDKDLVWTTAIVPTGETLENGVEVCKIVKRESTIALESLTVGESRAIKKDAKQHRLDTGMGAMSTSAKRGRYNDADRMIGEQVEYERSLGDFN